MSFSVRDRSRTIATFRFTHVFIMETLARWVPTSPELEAKVLFGEHIWDAAQHADMLGKRSYELRAPKHQTLEPDGEYQEFLGRVDGETGTAERIRILYDVLLPDLIRMYESYLERTDRLMDAPTVRIVEQILRDLNRMILDSRELRREVPELAADTAHAPSSAAPASMPLGRFARVAGETAETGA